MTEDSLKIDLNNSARSIIKVGLSIRAVMTLTPGLGAFVFGIHILGESPGLAIFCFTIGLGLFYLFFRILNSAFFREWVLLTPQTITVVHKTLTNEKKYILKLDHVKFLGFSDQKYTKHAMDNPVVDFTGLAAREKELQYIIDEGNIKIETGSQAIKFGKNMPSWEVDEFVRQVELFTGRSFGKAYQAQELP